MISSLQPGVLIVEKTKQNKPIVFINLVAVLYQKLT